MVDEEIQSLERSIERRRTDLVLDLRQLRESIRSSFDPREQIRAHPRLTLFLAFAFGFTMASLARPRNRRSHYIRLVLPR
jgi:hypothetical protein